MYPIIREVFKIYLVDFFCRGGRSQSIDTLSPLKGFFCKKNGGLRGIPSPPFTKKNRQIVVGAFTNPISILHYYIALHPITFYSGSRMCTSGKPSRTGLPESTRSSTLPPTNRPFPTKALPVGHHCHWPGGLEFAVESDSTKKFHRSRRTCAETPLSQATTSTNNNILKLIRRFV